MSDMAELAPRLFTVDECHRMADVGLFVDERVELLDGVIATMNPIGDRRIQPEPEPRPGLTKLVPSSSRPFRQTVAVASPSKRDGPHREDAALLQLGGAEVT
ncbi:MAG: hypothetical protein ABR975_13330 [Vulcanimicrobiaceae bacterium]